MVTIELNKLLEAVEWVSVDGVVENSAYICPDTGKIYFLSSEVDVEEEVPDDLETSDKYIQVPDKRDLDLGGARLPLSFVAKELPDDYDVAAGFFRRKGAYGNFKDLLHARGARDKWHAFEQRAAEAALREWCEENGVELSFRESAPDADPKKG